MSDVITINMILDFSKSIMEKSKEYSDNATLVSKSLYENLNTKELKKEISSLFQRFQEISYIYKFPEATPILSSKSWEQKENMLTNYKEDRIGKRIEKQIDDQLWATMFYYRILNLAAKLTQAETVYLIDTFLRQRSESVISEKLGICKNTLKGIKKSFLVKAKCELEDLFE